MQNTCFRRQQFFNVTLAASTRIKDIKAALHANHTENIAAPDEIELFW